MRKSRSILMMIGALASFSAAAQFDPSGFYRVGQSTTVCDTKTSKSCGVSTESGFTRLEWGSSASSFTSTPALFFPQGEALVSLGSQLTYSFQVRAAPGAIVPVFFIGFLSSTFYTFSPDCAMSDGCRSQVRTGATMRFDNGADLRFNLATEASAFGYKPASTTIRFEARRTSALSSDDFLEWDDNFREPWIYAAGTGTSAYGGYDFLDSGSTSIYGLFRGIRSYRADANGHVFGSITIAGGVEISTSAGRAVAPVLGGKADVFIDPYLAIAPEYLAANPDVTLEVLGGVGNAMPVPEPSPMALLCLVIGAWIFRRAALRS